MIPNKPSKKQISIVVWSVFCILFYFFPTVSTALLNSEEKIYIEADHVNYDYKKGIVNYQGNVHAKQGYTDLTANQMLVYYNQNHKIEKVVAIGKLASYKTLLNEEKDALTASARTITYFTLLGKVFLETDAKVEYNQNTFSGPYIFYDMNNKIISSHPKQPSQSKIVLEPIKQLKLNKK